MRLQDIAQEVLSSRGQKTWSDETSGGDPDKDYYYDDDDTTHTVTPRGQSQSEHFELQFLVKSSDYNTVFVTGIASIPSPNAHHTVRHSDLAASYRTRAVSSPATTCAYVDDIKAAPTADER